MKQIGFVKRIMGSGDYCFIRRVSDGEEFFSHVRDFKDPETMKVGQYVRFTPVPIAAVGKNPAATDVEAIQQLAA